METTFDYLRVHAVELGARILETYLPLQSTRDAASGQYILSDVFNQFGH